MSTEITSLNAGRNGGEDFINGDHFFFLLKLSVRKTSRRRTVFFLDSEYDWNVFSLFPLYRCTIIEIGPVETKIGLNAQDWQKNLQEADEKTKELKKIWDKNFLSMSLSKKMDCSEIAAIIQDIILGQNTKFRCYTHADFMADALAAKVKDSATNEPIEIISKMLFEKREDEN